MLLNIVKKFVTNFIMGLKIWARLVPAQPPKRVHKRFNQEQDAWGGVISATQNGNSRCALAYILSLRGPAKALHQRAR